MNKILKKTPLLTALLASILLLPQVASAQWAVEVVADVNTPTFTEIASSTTTTATGITELNTYLQTGYNGNGLIPLLSSINDKLGKSNSNEANAQLNDNVAARERMYDDYMLRMKADATPTQEEFQRACVAITSRMTSPQGGGAAGGTSDAFRGVRAAAVTSEQRFSRPAPSSTRLADLVRDRQGAGFCSEEAVATNSPGCKTAGAMPNADLRASSLTMGATASPTDATNGSLSPQQQQAAIAYIENSLPQPPDIPKESARNTTEGRAYMVYLNKFVARTAAGRDAMSNILASHAALSETVGGQTSDSPMMQNWLKMESTWGRIFGPQLKFPRSPSERDQMRFYVFRYASDPNYPSDLAHMSEKSLLQELIQVNALNSRINFQILERLEDTNKLLFQISNNQLDPVTVAAMNNMSKRIPDGTPAGKTVDVTPPAATP